MKAHPLHTLHKRVIFTRPRRAQGPLLQHAPLQPPILCGIFRVKSPDIKQPLPLLSQLLTLGLRVRPCMDVRFLILFQRLHACPDLVSGTAAGARRKAEHGEVCEFKVVPGVSPRLTDLFVGVEEGGDLGGVADVREKGAKDAGILEGGGHNG